jgi:hypothetical protein
VRLISVFTRRIAEPLRNRVSLYRLP